jgi:class 3 adenylate cyclase/tetratricopeptide (TPR) repeat protein
VSDDARTLGAYIPQDRRRALAEGRGLPDRQQGSMLFADLSGFTALTERLANRLGPLRGAEELGAWLRRIYDPLIACVDVEGGSVLGYAGDAVSCFFDGDDGVRAVRVARAMQREVARLDDARAIDGSRLGVRVKVSVAVGPVRRFVAGDPERRLWDVMAGSTLVRLAAAEQLAEAGEILVDATAARAAGLVGLEDRDGARVVPADADAAPAPVTELHQDRGPWPSAEVAAPWAPEVVREVLEQGGGPLGDFRPAGAVFLSFAGIDWDADPRAGERLDRFLRFVQRELVRAGGTLVQVTVGDKGSYLYAAFGAPRAHGDDAERAIRCALRLVAAKGDEIGAVDGLRAGVAYGAMYTGSYGATQRATYGVLGPKTNLAARLMKRAGAGEVLCDPEAARRARRAIRFSALPAESFKGVAKPVPLHRAVRELREEERDGGAMFGRDAERIDVGGLLLHLQHGSGAYLRYQGEAGIGKSRLLAWAREAAGARDVRVLSGSAAAEGREAGYAIWRGLVRGLLDLPEGASGQGVRSAVERVAPDLLAPERLEAVRALIAPDPDEAARDGVARREAIGHAVRALLEQALSRGSLLLLMDDLHQVDERSLDLLGRVVGLAGTAPLGLIAAHRPLGGEVAKELERHLPGPAKALTGLEAEASRMLIARVLGVPAMSVPYAVATAIHERAGGVPVLVEEIVRDLVERDALRAETSWRGVGREARGRSPQQAQHRVTFDEAALRDLKGGLDALLLARIDRLTSSERTAMKTAAVIGRTAEHQPLAHLLEADPVALASALSPLEGPDMLEALPDAHRFQQTVLHDAAYENLLFEQRRSLHRRMSAWYLQQLQAGREVDLARMAYHLFHASEGEDDPQLVRPALAALENLAARYVGGGAYEEALAALGKAEKLVPEGHGWAADRARVLIAGGELLERTGQHGAARRRYRAAAEAAQRAGDAAREAQAQSGLASLALEHGEADEAEDVIARARELAQASGDDAAVGRAELMAARAREARGAPDEAVRHARRAVEAWERANVPDELLRGRVELGRLLLVAGAEDEAEPLLRSALGELERAGHRHLEALAVMHLGEIARARGRTEDAERDLSRALAIFEEDGAAREAMRAGRLLGELALDQGRLVEADRRFQDALQAASAQRAAAHAVAAAVGRARVAWLRGHHDWALGILDAAAEHRALDGETARRVEEARAEAERLLGRRELDERAQRRGFVRIEEARNAPVHASIRSGRGGRGGRSAR